MELNFITGKALINEIEWPIRIDHFPDGQLNLLLPELNRKDKCNIIYKFTNSDDIFIFMQLVDILQRQEIYVNRLIIYYLLCARQDRVIDYSQPFSLKVIANVINSLSVRNVGIVEPHSERSLQLINNSYSLESGMITLISGFPNYTLCYPDDGAMKRYISIFGSNYICCNKHRDPKTNLLSGFEISQAPDYINNTVIMLDDLCDGGGTFCGMAPVVREYISKNYNMQPQLVLVITHAIQKVGIEKVAKVFDQVYISNSYKDWNLEELPKNVNVFDCIDGHFLYKLN